MLIHKILINLKRIRRVYRSVLYTARECIGMCIRRWNEFPIVSFERIVCGITNETYNIRIRSNSLLDLYIVLYIHSHEFVCSKDISREAVISVLSSTIYCKYFMRFLSLLNNTRAQCVP